MGEEIEKLRAFFESHERYSRPAKNGVSNVEILIQIAKELIEHTKDEQAKGIVKFLGQGSSSRVYQIGEYVIKIGSPKNYYMSGVTGEKHSRDTQMDVMPNSRYILQPIIRQYIDSEVSGFGMTAEVNSIGSQTSQPREDVIYKALSHETVYIEVQNLVDMDWQKGKSAAEIMEIIETVFENLLSEDLLSYDMNNVGRLIKPNRSNISVRDIETNDEGELVVDENGILRTTESEIRPTQEGIRMTGALNDQSYLKPGEYVLVDTEYVEDISKLDEETKKKKIEYARSKLKQLREDFIKFERETKQQNER